MNSNGIPKATVFLSQSIRGGNSSVCDAFSAIVGGVTWCKSPPLLLQSDQKIKLRTISYLNDISLTVIEFDDYDNANCIFIACSTLRANPLQDP